MGGGEGVQFERTLPTKEITLYSKTKKKVRHTICESLDVSQALQIRNTAVKELNDNPTVMAERSEANFSKV